MRTHGRYATYQDGCRCDECRRAVAEYTRDYRQRKAKLDPVAPRDVQRREKPTDWMGRGNCVGVDPELFFPGRGDMAAVRDAKQVCAGCAVKAECLTYANTFPVEWQGVWGGKTETERRKMRKAASA